MWYKTISLIVIAYIGLMAVYYESSALTVVFMGAMACFILALLIEDQYRY